MRFFLAVSNMPRNPRKTRESRRQPHEAGTLRLTRVRVRKCGEDCFLFNHAGVQLWAPYYAFAGTVDLRTTTLYLRPQFAHHVVPNGSVEEAVHRARR